MLKKKIKLLLLCRCVYVLIPNKTSKKNVETPITSIPINNASIYKIRDMDHQTPSAKEPLCANAKFNDDRVKIKCFYLFTYLFFYGHYLFFALEFLISFVSRILLLLLLLVLLYFYTCCWLLTSLFFSSHQQQHRLCRWPSNIIHRRHNMIICAHVTLCKSVNFN